MFQAHVDVTGDPAKTKSDSKTPGDKNKSSINWWLYYRVIDMNIDNQRARTL